MIWIHCTDGVLGCELAGGTFVEESNFHIKFVKMKVKIRGKEAGWIVSISDVLGEQEQLFWRIILLTMLI